MTAISHPIGDEATTAAADVGDAALVGTPMALFQRVQQAKQEWEATADALDALICLVDATGRVLRANQTVARWGLASVYEAPGRDFHTLLHPHCPGCELQRHLLQALATVAPGSPFVMEQYDPALAKEIEIGVYPVKGDPAAGPHSVLVARDITAQKAAGRSLTQYAARLALVNKITAAILAAHSLADVVAAVLAHLHTLFAYDQALVILLDLQGPGYTSFAADAAGRTHSLHHADGQDRPPMPPCLRLDHPLCILPDREGPAQAEDNALPAGIQGCACVLLSVEAEIIGWMRLGFARDSALSSDHTPLLIEIGDLLAVACHQAQLRGGLRQANAALRQANQAKDEMIQNVSHELRTPLAIISGYVELLQDQALGPLQTLQLDALEIIGLQNRRLGQMVDQLISLQLVDTARLNRAPTDLAALVYLALRSWRARAAEVGIELSADIPSGLGEVDIDIRLFEHVIYNLIDNAIKFSKPGGHVSLSAAILGDHYHLIVRDDGIGIPAHSLSRVFDRFYQVDNRLSRAARGMGLGLSFCQKIVDAHGGRIWVESAGPDQGCTFYIALPLIVP